MVAAHSERLPTPRNFSSEVSIFREERGETIQYDINVKIRDNDQRTDLGIADYP